jgi:exonuclease SbcC
MILNTLELENIRSYDRQAISFPLGTILFEGDIGSGKSTILNAIEFALFGLGSQRGGSLLRLGTNKGAVTLTFTVEGRRYVVHRSLVRRRKAVRHGTDGYVETDQGRLALSATELKERILDILKFNEPPNPKAQSVIYRYAVFTPQEEMKVILTQKPDARLQTLRKAFGVEDYKTTSENAQNATRTLRRRARFLDGQVADLARKEGQLTTIRDEITKTRATLTQLRTQIDARVQHLTTIQAQLAELQETRRTIERAKTEIPHYRREIHEKSARVERLTRENAGLTTKIRTGQATIDELANLDRPTTKSTDRLTSELAQATADDRNLRREEAQTDAKLADYRSVEANELCPTCDRPIDPKEFHQKIAVRQQAKDQLHRKVQAQARRIRSLKDLQASLHAYSAAQHELERTTGKLDEWQGAITANHETIRRLTGDVQTAKDHVEAAIAATKDLETVTQTIASLDDEERRLESTLRTLRRDLDTNTGRITTLGETIDGLNAEIAEKKAQVAKRDTLRDHQVWLSDYFIPTLDVIERHVMVSIYQEFNQHCQRWFNMLIDDPDLDVTIDEDFTPTALRDGYDQDLMALSGGEKTSVALAYRLALNTIVQKVSVGMKSNLLILDEPTDGFSKEQLHNIRDILTELRCPQIIMVSHERELESFADQIYRITKTDGVSRIVTE